MGLIVVLTLAIGLLTPPYGLCLLIAADLAKLSTAAAVKALAPFYLISLAVVIFAVLFPDIGLWSPRASMPGFGR
jgi:TRAP-type C4-dicarboxylate transport system permease large subunit